MLLWLTVTRETGRYVARMSSIFHCAFGFTLVACVHSESAASAGCHVYFRDSTRGFVPISETFYIYRTF